MADSNLTVFVGCTCVLYVKMMLGAWGLGAKKSRAGGRPPEDNSLSLASRFSGGQKQTYGLDKTDDEKVLKAREEEKRWARIVGNDLENIPVTLLVFCAGVLARSNPTVHAGAMAAFTLARCVHTYVYAHGLQPHRAIAYAVGAFASLVGVGNAVAAIL